MTTTQFTALTTAIMGFATVVVAYTALAYIIYIVASWRIFTKAGQPGWKALIPGYNLFVQYGFTWDAYMAIPVLALRIGGMLLQRSELEYYATVGMLCGLIGLVLYVIGLNKLARSFGHGAGFTAGLLFLEPVFILLLAFGQSEYQGNVTHPESHKSN